MYWIKHNWDKNVALALLLCGLLSCAPAAGPDTLGPGGAEWPDHARDKGGTRYSPLDQINRDNVRNLQIAWKWRFPADQAVEQHPEFETFIYRRP